MNLTFSVIDWCGWIAGSAQEPGGDRLAVSAAPDVTAIPALLRRRLNPLGRAAASQMMKLLDAHADIPIVYCSRHGDIERTLSILSELAAGQPVSPMNFSLSVHNAVPGVVSIHNRVTSAISSIASGDEALVPGLLEALGMLSPECPKVLCAFADVALPEIYQPTADDAGLSYACCFVLSQAAGGDSLSLEFVGAEAVESSRPVALAFARFLASPNTAMSVSHNGGCWRITKR